MSTASDCPEWEKFLESIVPDREQRELLGLMCGAILVGYESLENLALVGQPNHDSRSLAA